jgi:ABC-type Zn uptake system ZnuABC Zn-binding protein ZnuA
MKADGMRVILVEPFQSRKTAQTVAGHTGATVVEVCQFPGGLPGTDDDYFALIDAVVDAIADALGQAAAR